MEEAKPIKEPAIQTNNPGLATSIRNSWGFRLPQTTSPTSLDPSLRSQIEDLRSTLNPTREEETRNYAPLPILNQNSSDQARIEGIIQEILKAIESEPSLEVFAVNNEDKILDIYAKTQSLKDFVNEDNKDRVEEIKSQISKIEVIIKHHQNIRAAINELKAIGFELALAPTGDEFNWSTRTVLMEDGKVQDWESHFISSSPGKFRAMSSNEYSLIVFPRLHDLSKSVGDFGKSYKELMSEPNLKKWRSINKLLLQTIEEIKGTLVP